MTNLSTHYLGLSLKNPFVASSSPLTEKVESAVKLEEAGVSALVLTSLFEEQVINESWKLHRDLERGAYSNPEAVSYFPDVGRYSIGADRYVENLAKIKQAVSIPVLGSLNGVSTGGWIEYAQRIEQAGADALELNLYNLATDPDITASELEDQYITLVSNVRQKVHLPISVKLSPFFTALPNFTRRLAQVGANGVVLFNRFYQPDFDLEELQVVPHLVLSTSAELRLPLRWIAILHGRVPVDFGLTGGVHTAEDLLKAVMAGASACMVASALLKNGLQRVEQILTDVVNWMEKHEYESVEQMKGSMSQSAVGDPAAFERANYMKVLNSY